MKAPDIKTPLPGPKARAIIERDARFVSPSYTRDYPFVIARGEGAIVEDVDGNRFLDCAAGIAVNSTGVSHPDVVRAITAQAQSFIHMSGTDFYYDQQVNLAETMAGIVPVGGGTGKVRSFFSNSGAEAVEAALKLARYSTKRYNIIAFLGSFHGRTMGALAATSSKYVQRRGFGPMMPGVYHAPYANCYRCPVGQKPDTCHAECLAYLEEQILIHLVSPDEVAAVLVEPIQGEGGYVVPPKAFLQRLRELTSKHGMLLIADEVQCGFGRTGKLFALEHYGLAADIIVTAKSLGAGMPVSATTGRAEIMDATHPGGMGGTYGGNPVTCVAAIAAIEMIRQPSFLARAERVGTILRTTLDGWKTRHPLIGDVRGLGSMMLLQLVKDRATKQPARSPPGGPLSPPPGCRSPRSNRGRSSRTPPDECCSSSCARPDSRDSDWMAIPPPSVRPAPWFTIFAPRRRPTWPTCAPSRTVSAPMGSSSTRRP